MRFLIRLLPLAVFAYSLQCNLGGTSSDTDTYCTINGIIQENDNTPVANAAVTLHYQYDRPAHGLGKSVAAIRSGSTSTDIDGKFRIDSVDTGRYLVEVNDRDINGTMINLLIGEDDMDVEADGVVAPLGRIEGRVDSALFADSPTVNRHFYAFIPELERTILADSTGRFAIPALPAWNYHVYLMTSDSVVVPGSDSVIVPVVAGDTILITHSGNSVITQSVVDYAARVDSTRIADSLAFALDTNLLVYYPLDGNANDMSGHGFNATVENAVLCNDRFGNPQSAYYFNGNAGISATVSNRLSRSRFSMSVWIKGANPTAYLPRLVAVGLAENQDNYYGLLYCNGVLHHLPEETKRFIFMNGQLSPMDYELYYSNGSADTTAWHHAVVTYDERRLRFYIDGTLDNDTFVTTPVMQFSDTAVITIGCDRGPDRYNGYLDDVRIYGRVLSSSEIASLYITPLPVPLPDTGLVSFWDFDSTSGDTYYDVTRNGYNAVSSGLSRIPGIVGQAIHFPGSGYEFIVQNSAAAFNLTEFTVELWFSSDVSAAQLTSPMYIFNQQFIITGVRNGYGLYVTQSGNFNFGMSTSDASSYVEAISSTVIEPQRWYHVAATFDADSLKIFVDGSLERSIHYDGGGTYPPSTANAHIGCQTIQDGTVHFFTRGSFDQLKLFRYALPAAEVREHYEALRP